MENYQYVSEEYATQLHELAHLLVTPERFGHLAVKATVEVPEPCEAVLITIRGESNEESQE